jgi:hypothetical protein
LRLCDLPTRDRIARVVALVHRTGLFLCAARHACFRRRGPPGADCRIPGSQCQAEQNGRQTRNEFHCIKNARLDPGLSTRRQGLLTLERFQAVG